MPRKKERCPGLGNISVAVTYNLAKKGSWVLATKGSLSLNSASEETRSGLRTGYRANGFGYSLLAGLGKANYFASAEAGFTYWTNDYLPRTLVNAQIGTEGKRALWIFALGINWAVGAGNNDRSPMDDFAVLTGLYLNEQSYAAGTFKFGYKFAKNWTGWLSAGGGYARDTGQGIAWGLSIGYRLRK